MNVIKPSYGYLVLIGHNSTNINASPLVVRDDKVNEIVDYLCYNLSVSTYPFKTRRQANTFLKRGR